MPAVLLVDDRPENLVALKAVLEPLGQELVAVGSGADALRVLLHRDDFAVILLDAQMPQMDGFETAQMIKERERTRNIPIIFLTAISKERDHVFRGYEVGAVDYVFKPLDPQILRGKVSVFLELYEKNEELRRQRELLGLQEMAELRRESAERYRQLADAMPQIVWTADPEGRTTYYNGRWFEYTGMHAEPGAKVGWAGFVHPDDLEETVARRKETLRTGEVFEIEYRFRRADGAYRWHLGRAVPIRDEDGEIEFWVGTATDIDDRKRSEEGQRFLLDAGAELSRSLDYEQTLATLARLTVPRIGDWCSVDVAEPDGTIVQVALEHADPARAKLVRELRERYPPQPNGLIGGVIESGKSLLIPEVTEALLLEVAADEENLDLLRALGLRSWLCVPLITRGDTFGALSLVAAESRRTLGEDDLRLAEELARRAAVAVDNARLYEAQLAAYESERILRARTERLQSLTSRLAPELTVEGVVEIAMDKILIVSEGSTALLGLVTEDGRKLELTARGHHLPDDPEKTIPYDHQSVFGEVFRTREPLWLSDRREWERYPESIGELASLQAIAVLPVATASRFFGLLAVVFDREREFLQEERNFLLAIARQAAQALDRARLYDEQSHIAHVLQHSLLPHTLPTIPGVELATSYRAAGRITQAGGDFYDAFESDDGHLVVIGDVCGKGPAAAALTALCRYTLRACALQNGNARPADMLRLLNRAILEQSVAADGEFVGEFATVTCVFLQTVDGELTATIASGGHPPTLIRRQNGLVEAYEPTGPIVGVLKEADFDEQTVALDPGDLVVLHTDGLNDARREAGDRLGEEPVRLTLASLGEDEDPNAAIAGFEALLGGLEVTDDVAIVVFRVGDPVAIPGSEDELASRRRDRVR
jgi:PAS domain S-box-containing protein